MKIVSFRRILAVSLALTFVGWVQGRIAASVSPLLLITCSGQRPVLSQTAADEMTGRPVIVATESRGQAESTCIAEAYSELPGVAIEFLTRDCHWTLTEAKAGVEVDYVVRIDRDIEGVIPLPLDAGWCGRPHTSGLILMEVLRGDGQRYCRCDVGLCQDPSEDPVTLRSGLYTGKFSWDGRNWSGPSDTGRSKGAPFPSGEYSLTVRAVGRWKQPDGEIGFEVAGSLAVVLSDSSSQASEPRASAHQAIEKSDTMMSFDPKDCAEGAAGFPWDLGEVSVQVLGREGPTCVFEYSYEMEGAYRVYKVRVPADGPRVTIRRGTPNHGGYAPPGIVTSFSLDGAELLRRGNVLNEGRGQAWVQELVPGTSSVIYLFDLESGTGPEVKAGSRVKIRVVRFADGDFTERLADEAAESTFTLGAAEIGAGVEKAVMGMKVGAKRRVRLSQGMAGGIGGPLPDSASRVEIFIELEVVEVH